MTMSKHSHLWEVWRVVDDSLIGYIWAEEKRAREAEQASIVMGQPVEYVRFDKPRTKDGG